MQIFALPFFQERPFRLGSPFPHLDLVDHSAQAGRHIPEDQGSPVLPLDLKILLLLIGLL